MDRRPKPPTIPIQNIYYLLSYAWDKGHYGQSQALEGIQGDSTHGLLTRMLVEALERIRSQTAKFSFHSTHTIYPGIKGKVDIAKSLKHKLLNKGKTWVSYESLVSNELYLQIAKGTWDSLALSAPLPRVLYGIQAIDLSGSTFRKAQSRYREASIRYLLQICEWIHAECLPSAINRGTPMEGIILNPQVMPSLFEAFVRNFFKQHAIGYSSVGRMVLHWQTENPEKHSLFPKMETDVTLVSPSRKIVVETKYYREALQNHFRSEVPKFHSSHLYQLFAYLKHSGSSSEGNPCEGLLIYPTVNFSLQEFIELKGHPVRVCTLDLNRPWKEIHEELLGWVEK